MFENLTAVMAMLIPIVGAIALFSFLAVAAYSEERRKEREAHYRYEFRKKLIEQGGVQSTQLLELLREEEASEYRRRHEKLKLGGLVTTAVGLGMVFGLRFVEGDGMWQVGHVGYIPLFIGIAIVLYALFLSPRRPPDSTAHKPPA